MDTYFEPYLVVGAYGVLIVITAVVLWAPPHIFVKRRETTVKEETYECGVPLLGGARERFSVKFYIIAILFVLFDIETIFLFPWAVVFRSLGFYGFVEMVVFIGLLALGFLYAWRRGGLDWD